MNFWPKFGNTDFSWRWLITRTSSKWGKFWLLSSTWPWRLRSIAPQNNRALNQGLLHLWSKFGDPSLNGWWIIARTSSWLTGTRTHTHIHIHTHAGNDNTRRPKLALGKKLTLKIQGQGHGWGQSSKSQCESNILSTHIPFVPCQSGIPLLSYHFFKIWPWNSRVKVIDEVTVQTHNVGITSYRLTSLSLHVNRPSHSWDTAFSKFDLENQGSRSWERSQLKSQWGSNILSTHIPFVPCQSGIPFLNYDFQNLTL